MEPWLRRTAYIVGMALVVWVTWRVFGHSSPDISAGTATAYATFGGTVLAAIWGLYRYLRGDK